MAPKKPPVDLTIVRHDAELPTVPDAFRRSEYEGWLQERVKRFQLRAYEKTQARRIAVLGQINELQKQCLAIARNERDWQHFAQEDRIRKKQLDLREIELDHGMEDLLYRREVMLLERTRAAAVPPPPPQQRDPVEDVRLAIEEAIRMQTEVWRVFNKAQREHPELKDLIDELQQKAEWDLKERKWF